ncbi:MAG: glycosyltransferase family 2 protein [Alistipes sp.]|nr:glycosyltransferase family 2 protein [Alistipes sp.]
MKVAVVILNYNGVAHLRRFMPTVVDGCKQADLYVADNGSTDDSLKMLEREYAAVKRIVLDKNYGFAEGYNRALAQLEGYDCFVLLNSDVMTPENWLAPLIEKLESDPTIAVVGPKIMSVAEPSKFEYAGASGGFIDYLGYPFCRGRILSETEVDHGQYNDSREVFWVGGAAFCIRADVYRALGGLCGDFFAHMEEIDLCWRVQLAGLKVVVEPKSMVFHLGGGTLKTNSPRKIFLNHRNNLAMLFRCASPMQRAVVAVVRPVLDLAAALSYRLKGDKEGARAVFAAWRDFLRWHSRLSAERKAIRKDVKRESQYIYKGAIVWRYLLGNRQFEKNI